MCRLKELLSISIFILLSLASMAQNNDISIQISESDRKGMFEGIHGVVGKVDDGFYVLRLKSQAAILGGLSVGAPTKLFIDKYSNDLELLSSVEIDGITITTSSRSRMTEYEFCIQDEKGNLFVYFSEFVKGINSLYRIQLNDDLISFGDEVLVYRDKRENKRLDRRGSFDYVESEDRKNFAIYSFVNERTANYTEVYAATFTRSLEPIWEMNENIEGYIRGGNFSLAFQNSYKSLVGKNLSMSLSNTGVLNVMRKIYDETFIGSLAGSYSHLIYSLSGPENKTESRFFDFEETFILEAMIRHDQNNELKLVGYIGDSRYLIEGLVFINLDAVNLETVTKNIVKFTDRQKEDFLVSSDADSRRKQRGDSRTKKRLDKGKRVRISARNGIVNAYVHDDNSSTVVSEYFDTVTTSTRDANGNLTTNTTYIYGDLKYVNISEDGKIRWIKNIHKNQRSGSITLLSIADLFLNDKITYIYNDFEDRQLMLTTMNSEGVHESFHIADLGRRGELENHWFVPSSVKYLSENEIVGFAIKLLRNKLIKITL